MQNPTKKQMNKAREDKIIKHAIARSVLHCKLADRNQSINDCMTSENPVHGSSPSFLQRRTFVQPNTPNSAVIKSQPNFGEKTVLRTHPIPSLAF